MCKLPDLITDWPATPEEWTENLPEVPTASVLSDVPWTTYTESALPVAPPMESVRTVMSMADQQESANKRLDKGEY